MNVEQLDVGLATSANYHPYLVPYDQYITHGLAVKSATPGDGPNRKGRYGTDKQTVHIICVGNKYHRSAPSGCHDSAAKSLTVTSP
jgi:hypothetical protein